MDLFKEIYQNQAHAYHQMIAAEDYENNLLKTILQFTSVEDQHILDLGSGSGRLPLLFQKFRSELLAVDISLPMLLEQKTQERKIDGKWQLTQGDIRILPICNGWADVTTAGWAAGHFCGWYPDTWQQEIDRFILEMQRVTKSAGTLIIMETLGTGRDVPTPPTSEHKEYYQRIESKWGFQREVIRTDYKFGSINDAKEKTTFFFGQELSQDIDQKNWQIVPEWTGVWHRVN